MRTNTTCILIPDSPDKEPGLVDRALRGSVRIAQ
jgi:hypothetical protein